MIWGYFCPWFGRGGYPWWKSVFIIWGVCVCGFWCVSMVWGSVHDLGFCIHDFESVHDTCVSGILCVSMIWVMCPWFRWCFHELGDVSMIWVMFPWFGWCFHDLGDVSMICECIHDFGVWPWFRGMFVGCMYPYFGWLSMMYMFMIWVFLCMISVPVFHDFGVCFRDYTAARLRFSSHCLRPCWSRAFRSPMHSAVGHKPSSPHHVRASLTAPSNPAQYNQIHGDEAELYAIQSNPIQSNPILFERASMTSVSVHDPIRCNCIQSNPTKYNPIQSNPILANQARPTSIKNQSNTPQPN